MKCERESTRVAQGTERVTRIVQPERQAVRESLLAAIERYFDALTVGDSDRAVLQRK